MDAAIEYLRKNGQAKADKKSRKNRCRRYCKSSCKKTIKVAAIVEVNSETDFVAKNADFQSYVEEVANQALNTETTDIEAFLSEAWAADNSKTVKDVLQKKSL